MLRNGTMKKAVAVAILGLGVGAYSFLFADEACDGATLVNALHACNDLGEGGLTSCTVNQTAAQVYFSCSYGGDHCWDWGNGSWC